MTAPVSSERERAFELFGSRVRLLVSEDAAGSLPLTETLLRGMHAGLTRFEASSELSRLNDDERALVPVSRLLALALDAAARAHQTSGGLVDVTVLPALEAAGYRASRVGAEPADLRTALDAAPPRRAAAARGAGPPPFEVDLNTSTVHRPPGLRFDLGGIAKGFAADLAGGQFGGARSWVADCGGDIRIGGTAPEPREVGIRDPFADSDCAGFSLRTGAVATSGLRTRIWAQGEGFSHHLIDPSRATPAWTGVAQATAIAPSAVEAEALAKTALLLGPAAGTVCLARHGGLLVLDDGELVGVGRLAGIAAAAPEAVPG